MSRTVIPILISTLAALTPFFFLAPGTAETHFAEEEIPWPITFEGKHLQRLALSQREEKFVEAFPGKIARFTDGNREIIIRYVTQATRRLHPASDCLRGVGYSITPRALHVDAAGARWNTFLAVRGADRLQVRELFYTEQGQNWSDVSAWYWSVLMGKATEPTWAITVAESVVSG